MKAVCKKLLSLMLVAILLVSAVPFQVSAEEIGTEDTIEVITETTEQIEDQAEENMPELFGANPNPTYEVKIFYQLEDGTQVGDTVTDNMGEQAGVIPSGSEALRMYAKIHGNNKGYSFVRWYYKDLNGNKVTFNHNVYLHEGMALVNGNELNIYAELELDAVSIRLYVGNGSIANNTHKVKMGKTYNEVAPLPSPTPAKHYDFLYWVTEDDEIPVNGNTVVTSFTDLTAVYGVKHYDVVFQAHNGTAFAPVGEFTFTGNYAVEANKTLKVEEGYFPTDAQIKAQFALGGWTISGWEYSVDNGESWKEFKADSTKIVGNTIIRPVYKRNITLHANDKGHTTRSLEVTLGHKLPILPHPGTREGFAFVGWYAEQAATNLVCAKENLSNVSVHPVVPANLEALYAGWAPAKTVYLYIHTNGNTKEHTKLVRYYDVSVNGFNLKDVDLAEIFPNYGKYDDKGDEKWGWYDAAQWENFCMNKHKYETTEVVNSEYLSKDDVHEFYIMLNDNGNNTSGNNNYNDNKNTVDSSNPGTGDDIFVAVTVMAVSACAVLLIFMNKKRFVK